MNQVLIVSATPGMPGIWVHLLEEHGYRVSVVPWTSLSQPWGWHEDPSMVILDLAPSTLAAEACGALELVRDAYPGVPLVMLLPDTLPDLYRRQFEGLTSGCLQKPLDYGTLMRLVDLFVVRQREKRRIEQGIAQLFTLTPA